MKFRKDLSTIRTAASRIFFLLSLPASHLVSRLHCLRAKEKKKNDTTPNPATASILPDEQRIDNAIGEMLGALQLGDRRKASLPITPTT